MITRREFSRLALGGVTFLSGYGWAEVAKSAAKSLTNSATAATAGKHIDRVWVSSGDISIAPLRT
jgi:hypothetical protein